MHRVALKQVLQVVCVLCGTMLATYGACGVHRQHIQYLRLLPMHSVLKRHNQDFAL